MQKGPTIEPGSVGFFQPHDGTPLNLVFTVDPYTITSPHKDELMRKMKEVLEVTLLPNTLFENLDYKRCILDRISAIVKESP